MHAAAEISTGHAGSNDVILFNYAQGVPTPEEFAAAVAKVAGGSATAGEAAQKAVTVVTTSTGKIYYRTFGRYVEMVITTDQAIADEAFTKLP